MTDPVVIQGMIDQVEGQLESVTNGIAQIQAQIDEFNEEITALEDTCDIITNEMTAYLDGTKLQEIQILHPDATSAGVVYGINYGIIDYVAGSLADWYIGYEIDNPSPPPLKLPVILYQYLGTGWDGDTYISSRITDWAWMNDYLTRPLDSGATYGLIPNRDALLGALAILEEDKLKLEQSPSRLEPYAL